MDTRWLLLIGVAIISITETNALCGCALLGKDYCRCDRNIVRPVRPLTSHNCLQRRFCKLIGCGRNHKPIGDLCSCRLNIARPAHLPRTLFGCRRLSLLQDCEQEKCDIPGPVPPPIEKTKDYPADAVSLDLAYRLAKQATNNVPESRLSYGFESKPEESATKSINTNVPEENLWAMNRAILELNQPKQTQQISEEEIQDNGQSYLGYKDIGYSEEENKNPTFEVQKQSSGPISQDIPNNGNCGFKPLIIQQQVFYPHQNGQRNENVRECECECDCECGDTCNQFSYPQSDDCDCGCQSPIINNLRGCLRRYK